MDVTEGESHCMGQIGHISTHIDKRTVQSFIHKHTSIRNNNVDTASPVPCLASPPSGGISGFWSLKEV